MKIQIKGSCFAAGMIALAFVWAAGCGRAGPQRYDISGSVTYDGEPVPHGVISFDPVGQEMGGAFATIVDGKYATQDGGRGHAGGEHVVHIHGTAEQPPAADSPDADSYVVKALFPPFETNVELPRQQTTMDFDVPRNR